MHAQTSFSPSTSFKLFQADTEAFSSEQIYIIFPAYPQSTQQLSPSRTRQCLYTQQCTLEVNLQWSQQNPDILCLHPELLFIKVKNIISDKRAALAKFIIHWVWVWLLTGSAKQTLIVFVRGWNSHGNGTLTPEAPWKEHGPIPFPSFSPTAGFRLEAWYPTGRLLTLIKFSLVDPIRDKQPLTT